MKKFLFLLLLFPFALTGQVKRKPATAQGLPTGNAFQYVRGDGTLQPLTPTGLRLGTLARQDSNAVAIRGGTIEGLTRLLIGHATNAGYIFDLNGSARIVGSLTVTNGAGNAQFQMNDGNIFKPSGQAFSFDYGGSFTGTVTAHTLAANTTGRTIAPGTAGIKLSVPAYTNTDQSSAAGSTNPLHTNVGIAQPTFSSSNATTYTNAANVYIAGPPVAGTNVTITNAYGLYVASGTNFFGGAIQTTSSIQAASASNVMGGLGNPENSAVLTLHSTVRGFLPPRMTQAQRNAIASPAEGLMIYQTDNTKGWYGYNGTAWVAL